MLRSSTSTTPSTTTPDPLQTSEGGRVSGRKEGPRRNKQNGRPVCPANYNSLRDQRVGLKTLIPIDDVKGTGVVAFLFMGEVGVCDGVGRVSQRQAGPRSGPL